MPDWFRKTYEGFMCKGCGKFREPYTTKTYNHETLCDACHSWNLLPIWRRFAIAFLFAHWDWLTDVPAGKGWRKPLAELPIWKNRGSA
jgi:hypothetical protein